MTEAEAQAFLEFDRCPLDGLPLVQMGEYDGDGHSTYWQAWFECSGPARHYWHALYDTVMQEYVPTVDGAIDRYPMEKASFVPSRPEDPDEHRAALEIMAGKTTLEALGYCHDD